MERKGFVFYSSASLTRYTGLWADSLRSLLEGLGRVPGSSIFYHVHHALFRRHFTTAEFMNDFARWAWVTLHEERLAERLAALDPLQFPSINAARERLVAEVQRYLGEAEIVQHVPRKARFHFLDAQTFVFPSGVVASDLADFARKVKLVGADVIFHHFVSAPVRLGRLDNDFSAWIEGVHRHRELADALRGLSPYSADLWELRDRISELVRTHA